MESCVIFGNENNSRATAIHERQNRPIQREERLSEAENIFVIRPSKALTGREDVKGHDIRLKTNETRAGTISYIEFECRSASHSQ